MLITQKFEDKNETVLASLSNTETENKYGKNKREDSLQIQWTDKPEELSMKQKALKELLSALKEKQEEIRDTDSKLQTLIQDITNVEDARKVIEEYKEKCSRLEEIIRDKSEEYEANRNDILTQWTNERENLNARVDRCEKRIEAKQQEISEMQNEIDKTKEELIRMTRIKQGLEVDNILNVTYILCPEDPVSYTHLTLPTIYSV
eukprot:TRINITY_DN1683_c0_g2_i3.p1 TRINITY_DN1683_c0_g2~~TRINITY_DN1683_c0_g2_i3.p1  ORF type:complete len:205 (-),score=58.10 TRINITY_DN1683_c0_g2_i3:46-660(-)